jgi:DNA-binding GntR family transcriptional regulator
LAPYFKDFLQIHKQLLKSFVRRDARTAENIMRKHNQRMIDIIRTTSWGVGEESGT